MGESKDTETGPSNANKTGRLVGFYGISTFVRYLMRNLFSFEESILFQAIHFTMSTQFNCKKKYFKLFSLVK